jgi:tetratricopeptide (TPR) repeat protein
MKPYVKKTTGLVFRSLFLGVCVITFGCCKQAQKEPPVKNDAMIMDAGAVACRFCYYDQSYEHAKHLHGTGHYQEAIAMLEGLLATDLRSDKVDNYHYWLGENYFAMNKPAQAAAAFENLEKFGLSDKGDAALYMLVRCYNRLKKTSQAERSFTLLSIKYPKSKYIDQARTLLAGTYFNGSSTAASNHVAHSPDHDRYMYIPVSIQPCIHGTAASSTK